MKTIFLSVVVICALAVAGIGGTIAGWSDTEESFDNYISTGSLDLKVERTDDKPWGLGLPIVTDFEDIVPCYDYKTVITVENIGQGVSPEGNNLTAPLYIVFKEFACSNVTPTCQDGEGAIEWPTGNTPAIMNPEPELVAQYGGMHGQVHIIGDNVTDGNWGPSSNPEDWAERPDADLAPAFQWPAREATGRTGDVACSMSSRVSIRVFFGPSGGAQPQVFPVSGTLFLNQVVDDQIYLGELPQCGEDYIIGIWYHLENLVDAGWPSANWGPELEDWKTNSWMKDRIDFSIMFKLLDYNFSDPSNRGTLPQ